MGLVGEPIRETHQVDCHRSANVLQVRFGQTDIPGPTKSQPPSALRDSSFNPGTLCISLFELGRCLVLAGLLQSDVCFFGLELEGARPFS